LGEKGVLTPSRPPPFTHPRRGSSSEQDRFWALCRGTLLKRKYPPPLGPLYFPRHSFSVESQGGTFSHERGTPVHGVYEGRAGVASVKDPGCTPDCPLGSIANASPLRADRISGQLSESWRPWGEEGLCWDDERWCHFLMG